MEGMEYYLAVDIGASGGRHILGHLEEGKMVTEEIHRFPNGLIQKGDELCWDTNRLFEEIKEGMKKCRDAGKIPVSMGIDTWAVDFVLLDHEDRMLGNAVGYRDGRTHGMEREVFRKIPEDELYRRTGIQMQSFNTIFQLAAVRKKYPEYLERAGMFLMMPDYFGFLLTGKKAAEYTNATTTQMVRASDGEWDRELLDRLGYPAHIFPQIVPAGTVLGRLKEEIKEEIGFDCKVVLPATHDTGSAVLAVPADREETLYISSGTWSLMGVERKEADCSEESRKKNFTNEGGYRRRYRWLKNIMGLWMIQCVKREWKEQCGDDYTFQELCEMAQDAGISSMIDCNLPEFLAPDSMIAAVRHACGESGQQVPQTAGELARVIYRSLAACYARTVREIEELTGKTYEKLYVVGGGSKAEFLNRLTAEASGKTVLAGPAEATAVGNLMVQMITGGVWPDLAAARRCVKESFETVQFEPGVPDNAKGNRPNGKLC